MQFFMCSAKQTICDAFLRIIEKHTWIIEKNTYKFYEEEHNKYIGFILQQHRAGEMQRTMQWCLHNWKSPPPGYDTSFYKIQASQYMSLWGKKPQTLKNQNLLSLPQI